MSAAAVSIVVPTLNAATELAPTLEALRPEQDSGLVKEIIVVDGGSQDQTVRLARQYGVRVLSSPPGRARQLITGAGEASGQWLLFLHADTILQRGWGGEVRRFIASANANAAAFRYALNDSAAIARLLEAVVAWRCALLRLPYGDQGLLISRRFYDELGGFSDLPLMEDVDMARRIGRRRLTLLSTVALTGARRYQGGFLRRILLNAGLLGLYFLRVPPGLLARLYSRPGRP